MKTASVALKAHLAAGRTVATCWLCARSDGTVLGFTNHDAPLTFNLESWMAGVSLTAGPAVSGTGSVTYAASSGFLASDLQSASGLAVDSGEAQGALVSPAITETDLLAGLWDYCRITIFIVNWADLTMGAMIERSGTLGEITTDKGTFRAEWRGLTQAYAQNVGRLDSPVCNAAFGDARCGKDLTPLTFAGTVESVGDAITFFDSGLTQDGPAGGIAITNITNANPGVVTMASAGSFVNGDPVTLSGILGPTSLNTSTIIRSLSGSTWHLGVDTTDTTLYPPYGSGGTVTPLGGTAGFFDAGLVTWLTGLNAGLSEQVKSFVTGQVTLMLPMPYDIQVGDTYTIVAGCIKSLSACRDTHDNLYRMRALPFFPGIDLMVQAGRHG